MTQSRTAVERSLRATLSMLYTSRDTQQGFVVKAQEAVVAAQNSFNATLTKLNNYLADIEELEAVLNVTEEQMKPKDKSEL